MKADAWTFVIAYFNEVEFLAETIASIRAQDRKPARLILIDNASTDGSVDLAHRVTADWTDIEVVHLYEERPGKIFALEMVMAHLDTQFVAFGDADTWYPPQYLDVAHATYANGPDDLVAVMAVDVPLPTDGFAAQRRRFIRSRVASRLWPKQTHTGGFGQTFRTEALLRAGGYSHHYWAYVLMDHEVMQRVLKLGRAVYPPELWCVPSPRRSDRRSVRWTLGERLLYHFSPFAAKDWFFYRFLGPRLKERRLSHLNLREKTWETPPE